ncbi:unnamed protein product [Lupinus luteus]|uniref:Uncharacterized protein n=1 Tax=Lupinus luteus TaxID=3873 RepID=A0AAV1W6R2_LUPLU
MQSWFKMRSLALEIIHCRKSVGSNGLKVPKGKYGVHLCITIRGYNDGNVIYHMEN